MNLAKVSSNGQITVPVEVRRRLGLKEGDKVLFVEKDGEIMLQNSSRIAIREAHEAMQDVALSEEEVLSTVMGIRYGDEK